MDTNTILLILLSLQPHYSDTETPQERFDRMAVLAQSIDVASARATCAVPSHINSCRRYWHASKKSLVVALITIGWWESRFAQNVHAGKCKPWQCDATKTRTGAIVFRARSPWQIQLTGLVSVDEWRGMAGTDYVSTRTAAWAAARILGRSLRRCRTIHGAFSQYGRNRCDWSKAAPRVRFYRKLRAKTLTNLREDFSRRWPGFSLSLASAGSGPGHASK